MMNFKHRFRISKEMVFLVKMKLMRKYLIIGIQTFIP